MSDGESTRIAGDLRRFIGMRVTASRGWHGRVLDVSDGMLVVKHDTPWSSAYGFYQPGEVKVHEPKVERIAFYVLVCESGCGRSCATPGDEYLGEPDDCVVCGGSMRCLGVVPEGAARDIVDFGHEAARWGRVLRRWAGKHGGGAS